MALLEKVSGVLGFAGVGCFLFAGVVEGYLPVKHLSRIPVKTLDQIAPQPSEEFIKLASDYPVEFKEAYGQPTTASFHKALRRGRDIYIAEACWHCHSQFVRPVANEEQRFGVVSNAAEYQNEMFLPHLFGTRRVGPDLIRENGKHATDWHVAHFYDPASVVPTSVMPRFRWFFNEKDHPNEKGIAMLTYVQWLGSWVPAASRVQ